MAVWGGLTTCCFCSSLPHSKHANTESRLFSPRTQSTGNLGYGVLMNPPFFQIIFLAYSWIDSVTQRWVIRVFASWFIDCAIEIPPIWYFILQFNWRRPEAWTGERRWDKVLHCRNQPVFAHGGEEFCKDVSWKLWKQLTVMVPMSR